MCSLKFYISQYVVTLIGYFDKSNVSECKGKKILTYEHFKIGVEWNLSIRNT